MARVSQLDKGQICIAADLKVPVPYLDFGEFLAAVERNLDAVRKISAHGLRLTDQIKAEVAVTSTPRAAIAAGSTINIGHSESKDVHIALIMFQIGQRYVR